MNLRAISINRRTMIQTTHAQLAPISQAFGRSAMWERQIKPKGESSLKVVIAGRNRIAERQKSSLMVSLKVHAEKATGLIELFLKLGDSLLSLAKISRLNISIEFN